MDAEILRKQVMVSQFVNAVGCTPEQATQILQSAQWHFEVALSLFFQDHTIATTATHQHNSSTLNPGSSGGSSLGSRMSYTRVPTNTPATPPAFPDTLAAFGQMKASSPAESSSMLQEPTIVRCQKQASKS